MDVLELVEKGKVKRFFRARRKPSFEGAVCHITQRVAGKEPLFLEEADYLYMFHLIKEKSRKFTFEVFAFALMPNHVHILLRLGSENLASAMKNIFECYAIYFNKKYERKGHLFCGAYRSALCFDESYLIAASLYIHLNPVKAKIIKNFVEYRWSSCKMYVEAISKQTFLNSKFILQRIDEDISYARQEYKRMLSDLRGVKIEDLLENPKALDNFRDKVRKMFADRFAFIKEESKDAGGFLYDQDLENKMEELKKKGKLRSAGDIAARKFVIEQLRARGFEFCDIAVKLGVSRTCIFRTLKYRPA